MAEQMSIHKNGIGNIHSGATYHIEDSEGRLLFISPLTGQLLSLTLGECGRKILQSNGVFLDERASTSAVKSRLSLACRVPPLYESIKRSLDPLPVGFVDTLREKISRVLTAMASPAKIASNLQKIEKLRVVPEDLALEALVRSKKYGKNECYLQSESDGRILRKLGVPFYLVYGVLAPSNLMHAWVEIPIDGKRSLLLDQNIDFVNCFQTSLIYRFGSRCPAEGNYSARRF